MKQDQRRKSGNQRSVRRNHTKLVVRPSLEWLEDRLAPATFTVTNTNDTGAGSLRWAIEQANTQAGFDTIAFDLGPGVNTINLSSTLPTITDRVLIDGFTANGYTGTPLVELRGGGGSGNGLTFGAGAANSEVRGLAIGHFSGAGIVVNNANGVIIRANYIGLRANGSTSDAVSGNGISVNNATTVVIGGATAADRNVIANSFIGIRLDQANSATVRNNYLGTDASGEAVRSNSAQAMRVSSSDVTIRDNLIVGTGPTGIWLLGDANGNANHNLIQGNHIGTNALGTAKLGAIINHGILVQQVSGYQAKNNTIGGLAAGEGNIIVGASANGITINGAVNTSILGNHVGLLSDGTTVVGNQVDGILLLAAQETLIQGNTIGGHTSTSSAGIRVTSGSSDTNLYNNHIGINAAGTAAVANYRGVVISGAASNTRVGGVGLGNVISGNTLEGLAVASGTTGTVIQGNFVGTNATGTAAVGNAAAVAILANNTLVGGTAVGAGNLISGNHSHGLSISGATGVVVQGNFIGTNKTGTAAIANGGSGVHVSGIVGAASNLTIGGTAVGAGNVISGNHSHGVRIESATTTSVSVLGNRIGTDKTGTAALGNTGYGVLILSGSNGNLIGNGLISGGNTIAHNGRSGVGLAATSGNNQILANSIFGNAELGIDRHLDSVTLNTIGNRTNTPIIFSPSTTSISGVINGAANTNYRLEFFGTPSNAVGMYAQGKSLLFVQNLTTDANGLATFSTTGTFPADQTITVTATSDDGMGNFATSEFSAPGGNLVFTKTNIASGDGQNAVVGTNYAAPLRVRVTDSYGNAAVGAQVQFTAPLPDVDTPSVSFRPDPLQAPTNVQVVEVGASGVVSTAVPQASTVAGAVTVTATLVNAQSSGSIAFNLTNSSGQFKGLFIGGYEPNLVGTPGLFVIAAVDEFGNVVTQHTGTVLLSSNDSTAIFYDEFEGNAITEYTFTAADQGVRLLLAKFGRAGIKSITVSDSLDPTIRDTQEGIAISRTVEPLGLWFVPIVGEQYQGVVSRFRSNIPEATANDFSAMIDWGDGSPPTAGSVSSDGRGGFLVSGRKTYSVETTYLVQVTITHIPTVTVESDITFSAAVVLPRRQAVAVNDLSFARQLDGPGDLLFALADGVNARLQQTSNSDPDSRSDDPTLFVATYSSNPTNVAAPTNLLRFYDVRVTNVDTETEIDPETATLTVVFRFPPNVQSVQLYYFDGIQFLPVIVPAENLTIDLTAGTVTLVLDINSEPFIGNLNGTVFAVAVSVPQGPPTSLPGTVVVPVSPTAPTNPGTVNRPTTPTGPTNPLPTQVVVAQPNTVPGNTNDAAATPTPPSQPGLNFDLFDDFSSNSQAILTVSIGQSTGPSTAGSSVLTVPTTNTPVTASGLASAGSDKLDEQQLLQFIRAVLASLGHGLLNPNAILEILARAAANLKTSLPWAVPMPNLNINPVLPVADASPDAQASLVERAVPLDPVQPLEVVTVDEPAPLLIDEPEVNRPNPDELLIANDSTPHSPGQLLPVWLAALLASGAAVGVVRLGQDGRSRWSDEMV